MKLERRSVNETERIQTFATEVQGAFMGVFRVSDHDGVDSLIPLCWLNNLRIDSSIMHFFFFYLMNKSELLSK